MKKRKAVDAWPEGRSFCFVRHAQARTLNWACGRHGDCVFPKRAELIQLNRGAPQCDPAEHKSSKT